MNESVETYKRVVVDGHWDGNILPGSQEELLREVAVRAGGWVTGCILGHRVRIEGPSRVARAVYATAELVFVVDGGDIRCGSAVGSREVVSVTGEGGRLVIEGDVFGENVFLRDAVVRGSVHGKHLRLERCLVLGLVRAENLAELSETTVLSADAAVLQFGSGCGLLLPYARARERLDLQDRVRLAVADREHLSLGPLDVVEKEGLVHLTGGRRLTAFGQLRAHLDNVSAFMYQLIVGDAFREGTPPVSYDRDTLPRGITRFLTGGEDGTFEGRS